MDGGSGMIILEILFWGVNIVLVAGAVWSLRHGL